MCLLPILPRPPQNESSGYAAAAAAKSLQSCSTLCDPIDGSPPGSDVPGILQARTLEWVSISFQARILEWFAIFFSRGRSKGSSIIH